MLESSFQIGRVAGIRIGIHYTWLIIFFLLNTSLYYVFKLELADWSDTTALLTALLTSTAFFASIILHELGHSIVAIRNGINVKSITLFIFGGVAQTQKDSDTAIVEFKIAIAGPLVSLALAVLFIVARDWLTTENTPAYIALDWLATINFVVAIFNLVPGFPLDGGRVFRAIVWWLTGDEAKGMRLAVIGGRVVAYGLMAYGMVTVIQTGNILSGIWLIGIGWFLLAAAEASGRAFTQLRVFAHVSIDSLIEQNVPRIQDQHTIESWVTNSVLPELSRAALVERGDDLVGLVSLSDTNKIPQGDWARHTIGEIMTPAEKLIVVPIHSSIADILKTMQEHTLNQIPISDNGEVVGWITRESLLRALNIYSESRQY
jgi:Zn-dependent protease/predicted transcriptional regulator